MRNLPHIFPIFRRLDKRKITFLVLSGLFIVYLDVRSLLKMQVSKIKNVSGQSIKIKTDITKLNLDLLKFQETKQRFKTALKAKKNILPDELPAFLKHLSDLANKNKINIKEIKPSHDETAKTVLLALDLVGGYHNLGAFLNDLENAEELITVEELKITAETKNYLQQKVRLVLKGYVKK